MSSVVFSSVFSTAPLVGVVGVEDDLVSVDVVVPSCSHVPSWPELRSGLVARPK